MTNSEMKRTLAPCRRAGIGLAALTGLRAVLFVALALASRGVLDVYKRQGHRC